MAEPKTFKGLVALGLAAALSPLLSGCTLADFPILAPGGPVTLAERDILFRAIAIMMIVVIPVFVMAGLFCWRYRASNTKANYQPNWMSNAVDAVVWIVPALIVASLGVHVWIYTHSLDPYKPLDAAATPLEVQVVARRLEVAVHLSGAGDRRRQRTGVSERHAAQPEDHIRHGDERLLDSRARRPDLRDGGDAVATQSACRCAGHVSRPQYPIQWRRLCRSAFRGDRHDPD